VLNELVLQKEEMSSVQYLDGLTGIVLQEDFDSSFYAGKMSRIMLLGKLEIGETELIDCNLLRFGGREGRIGEHLNLQ
jgi:hypothetical protein